MKPRNFPRRRFAAPLALGVSLLATACGGSTTVAGEPPASAENSTPVEETESASNPLLTGSVGTVGGEQFDLGSLDGQDAVLWFWAPW